MRLIQNCPLDRRGYPAVESVHRFQLWEIYILENPRAVRIAGCVFYCLP